MRVRHPVYRACLNKDVLIKLWVCQNQNIKKKKWVFAGGRYIECPRKKESILGGYMHLCWEANL